MPVVQPAPIASRRVVVLAALLLVATALGGWRAVALSAGRHDPRTLQVGGISYAVTHVEQVTGLSDADLAGMNHNIQGLVTDKQLMVRVSLTATTGGSATDYDPSVLQLHVGGSRTGQAPVGGSFTGGRLGAHSTIEGTLSYVVARNGARLTLRAGSLPQEVPLTTVDTAPAGTGDHAHATSGGGPATAGPSSPATSK